MRQNKKNIKKDWLLSASEGLTGLKAPDEQPFEKFKELKFFIQQMASSGMVAHGSGWTSFLYELNEVCKLASTPVLGADIKRCSDCIHLQVDNSLDQTGPGIWCGKGHFDGIGSKEECDDLSKQNDCADFSRKQPYRSPVLPEVEEGEQKDFWYWFHTHFREASEHHDHAHTGEKASYWEGYMDAMTAVGDMAPENISREPSLPKQEGEKEPTLGAILKEARIKLGLKFSDVLEETGVSVVYLDRLETDDLKTISAGVLWKLATLYKLDLKALAIKAGIIIKKPPSPPAQEPNGPVCSTEFREPSEVVNFLESELSTANARIKELESSLTTLQREYLDARYELDRYRAALEEYAATEMNEIAKRALNNS
jgi:transcriptional regulator with XRE-family HTH domain